MSLSLLLGIIIFLLFLLTYFVWELWLTYKQLTIKQLDLGREAEKDRLTQTQYLKEIAKHISRN